VKHNFTSDSAFLTQASQDLEQMLEEDPVLNVDRLRSISKQSGSDYATAVLYAWFARSSDHGPLLQKLLAQRDDLSLPSDAIGLLKNGCSTQVVVVPGAFYQEYPQTGGGGESIMLELEALGVAVDRVPIRSTGTLQQNAEILRDFLQRSTSRSILLLSLSKGGADIKTALRDHPDCFKKVVLWVSIGGILSGTPLINWVRARPPVDWVNRIVFAWKKRDYRFFSQLATGDQGDLHFDLQLPSH
jgi:hypothetical protein